MQNLKLSVAFIVLGCAVLSIFLPLLTLQNTITALTALLGFLEIYSQRSRIQEFIQTVAPETPIIEPTCGDQPINLADQRLHVSLTFGTYFTSLLETAQLYTAIPGQLECARAAASPIKDPLQYAMWTLIDARGARILILAAEGGMGKSTLASKLIRCLYEREDIDMILGDSAKQQLINPTTGTVDTLQPGYDSASSFLERICRQLGLVYQPHLSEAQQITNIRDRLIGRRAIIVVDNLESVQHSDKLITILSNLVSRHIRAIVTTRVSSGFRTSQKHLLSIHIKPLTNITQIRNFMQWHIQRFQLDHPRLQLLAQQMPNDENFRWLLQHSGGIPLLVQILISEVARTSWMNVMNRNELFGQQLLDILYLDHWKELDTIAHTGNLARTILEYIHRETHYGDRITYQQLQQVAEELHLSNLLDDALTHLHERFLIINSDQVRGNFSIYPSLANFIQRQLLAE
jgi:hypothetical protein